jgi:hypothetical protein
MEPRGRASRPGNRDPGGSFTALNGKRSDQIEFSAAVVLVAVVIAVVMAIVLMAIVCESCSPLGEAGCKPDCAQECLDRSKGGTPELHYLMKSTLEFIDADNGPV